jgi:hypothetical protein
MTSNKISPYTTLISFTFIAFHYLLLSLLVILKVYCKISVLLGLAQNLQISDLAMAKVEKFNIAVTFDVVILCLFSKVAKM